MVEYNYSNNKGKLMRKIKNLQYALMSALALGTFVLAPVAVMAEGTNSGSGSTKSSTKTESTAEPTESPADLAERAARLTKAKTDLKIKLTDKDSLTIKTKCKPAQVLVRTVGDRVDEKVKDRATAYGELVDRLNGIVVKLKAKNVDTAELEKEITALKALLATFKTDLATYKTALADVKSVDCVTNPDQFKAALETARTANATVLKDAAAVKSYVKVTIKPTLEKIRKSLEAEEKAKSSESSTNSTTGAN
jgi:hypothetical protein